MAWYHRNIHRTLGISKNTVKEYLEKLKSLTTIKDGQGYTLEELFRMEHPVLESKFHPGNPAYKDDRYEDLKARLDYYLSLALRSFW